MKTKTTAFISYQNQEIVSALKLYGIKTAEVPFFKGKINNPEACHADMQIIGLPYGEIFLIKDNEQFNTTVEELISGDTKINYTKHGINEFKYPYCVMLNAAVVGINVFCNTKYTDKYLIGSLLAHNYNIIHVNQGYAKCSTAIVSYNAIITSDKGIASAAKSCGIDVLLISPRGIYLCEKYEGFIGGASVNLSKNKILFIGNIDLHTDGEKIRDFCLAHHVTPECLCRHLPLTDIGGAVLRRAAAPDNDNSELPSINQ